MCTFNDFSKSIMEQRKSSASQAQYKTIFSTSVKVTKIPLLLKKNQKTKNHNHSPNTNVLIKKLIKLRKDASAWSQRMSEEQCSTCREKNKLKKTPFTHVIFNFHYTYFYSYQIPCSTANIMWEPRLIRRLITLLCWLAVLPPTLQRLWPYTGYLKKWDS